MVPMQLHFCDVERLYSDPKLVVSTTKITKIIFFLTTHCSRTQPSPSFSSEKKGIKDKISFLQSEFI